MSKEQKWLLHLMYLGIVIAFSTITTLLILLCVWDPDNSLIQALAIIVGIANLIVLAIWLVELMAFGSPGSHVFYRVVEAGTIVVRYDMSNQPNVNKILNTHEFYWNNDYPYYRYHQFYSYRLYDPLYSNSTRVKTTLIVDGGEDKKVRQMTCWLYVDPPRDIKGVEKLMVALGDKFPKFDQVIETMLYDFCEEKSKELAGLFNPLRPEQQETFQTLLAEWLAPKLEPFGLTYKSSNFSLS